MTGGVEEHSQIKVKHTHTRQTSAGPLCRNTFVGVFVFGRDRHLRPEAMGRSLCVRAFLKSVGWERLC